ncbi:MAG TPA: FKBP-type peptidyl-prolyl cis-trans isomerase [Opitutaceae bacterium]|nr:FKBP-type peptidyl-prolyl cis-trans isomerase [Opitutaceae bacterium]
MLSRSRTLLVAALAAIAATTMSARSGFNWEELNTIDQKWPQAKATTTGLRYVVLQEGRGDLPRSGDTVKVLYKGMFFDGRVFDEALDPAQPFTFRLGRSQIIEGWEEGIALMRVGEKRILIVPYDLAYGSRGQPPRIPRQTSLVFEVEMLAIEPNTVPPPATAAKP